MRVCATCTHYRGYRYEVCQAFRIISRNDCHDWTPRPAPWWKRLFRREVGK